MEQYYSDVHDEFTFGFNSTGTRIYAVRPESYPIHLNGLNGSGIYLIRISTGTNKILTSKLIVK